MIVSKKIGILALITLGLAACSTGSIDPNQLVSDRDGNVVTGRAGPAWTDEELRTNQFAAVCAVSETITQLQITRDENGVARFSAVCV